LLCSIAYTGLPAMAVAIVVAIMMIVVATIVVMVITVVIAVVPVVSITELIPEMLPVGLVAEAQVNYRGTDHHPWRDYHDRRRDIIVRGRCHVSGGRFHIRRRLNIRRGRDHDRRRRDGNPNAETDASLRGGYCPEEHGG
jgi:hypothetical protein